MSKRNLQKYIKELKRKELESQLIDLYERFPVVKEFYDFAFNPKEDKLIQNAKLRISNEYYPVKRRKPKARRSVAQKFIKHFIKLGVDPNLIADLMIYNIEIAQSFSVERNVPDSFYKSFLNSFTQASHFVSINGLLAEYKDRIIKVYLFTQENEWPFEEDFSRALDVLD